MDETVIVVMVADEKTGLPEKELTSFKLAEYTDLMVNVFAVSKGDDFELHVKLTTPDVSDWQFDAVYDYYDADIFIPEGVAVTEKDNCYNPTWEFAFMLTGDDERDEEKLKKIIRMHKEELDSVFEEINGKEGEYGGR